MESTRWESAGEKLCRLQRTFVDDSDDFSLSFRSGSDEAVRSRFFAFFGIFNFCDFRVKVPRSRRRTFRVEGEATQGSRAEGGVGSCV